MSGVEQAWLTLEQSKWGLEWGGCSCTIANGWLKVKCMCWFRNVCARLEK